MTPQLILVVDDEPHILDNIQYALKKEGFEGTAARPPWILSPNGNRTW